MTAVHEGPLTGELHDADEDIESGSIGDVGTSLSAVDRAAIDVQIATAKANPRSITKSLREAKSLATLDEDTAASMVYAVKRAGKVLEGPSARLAEVMAYAWGNLRAETDIAGDDGRMLTAVGTCFDLEKNVAIRTRVKRRITDKHGRRYNDDMIVTTANAASSIALRNAVFKVIPRAFVNQVYQEARKASLGKGGTMAQKRQALLAWWAKLGVTEQEIFDLLKVKGADDIGEDQLVVLRGFANAVKEGEQTVDDLFRPSDKSEGTQELNGALAAKKANGNGAPTLPSAPPAASAQTPASAGNVCQECGGVNGEHKPDCRYFAD